MCKLPLPATNVLFGASCTSVLLHARAGKLLAVLARRHRSFICFKGLSSKRAFDLKSPFPLCGAKLEKNDGRSSLYPCILSHVSYPCTRVLSQNDSPSLFLSPLSPAPPPLVFSRRKVRVYFGQALRYAGDDSELGDAH